MMTKSSTGDCVEGAPVCAGALSHGNRTASAAAIPQRKSVRTCMSATSLLEDLRPGERHHSIHNPARWVGSFTGGRTEDHFLVSRINGDSQCIVARELFHGN